MNPSKALNLLLKKVFFINDFHANKLMSGKSVICVQFYALEKIRENAFFKRILPWIPPKSVKKKLLFSTLYCILYAQKVYN